MMRYAWIVLLAASLFGPTYALAMGLIIKRRAPMRPAIRDPRHEVVVMVPCLNEGLVVTATIDRLLALDDRLSVLVLDDASDDETPGLLRRIRNPRVHVVRREFPNARVGKGAALNQGLRHIDRAVAAKGIDPDDVIIAVFDADGWADPSTLDTVLPWFSVPDVGAAQIGVRINNRDRSWLARMQDLEFAAYTEIFQRARNAISSTGLGGNGQFARLSALNSIGPDPWTDCLTEDLDLGIRLRIAGWRSMFDGSVAVHQQGLHSPRRLVRQRTRWFQGHLQSWGLLPRIWRSDLPLAARLDMSGHLLLPVFMLLISIGVVAGLLGLVRSLIAAPAATLSVLSNGPFVPWWYLLGFAATPMIAAAYWRAEPSVGFWRGLGLAHGYAFYSWVWFPAGTRALWRQAFGAAGWAKTARVAESSAATDPIQVLPLFPHLDLDLAEARSALAVGNGVTPMQARRAHAAAVVVAEQLPEFRAAWRIRFLDDALERVVAAHERSVTERLDAAGSPAVTTASSTLGSTPVINLRAPIDAVA